MSMAQEYHFSTILPNMDTKLMLLVANACSCYRKQWSMLYQCDRAVTDPDVCRRGCKSRA